MKPERCQNGARRRLLSRVARATILAAGAIAGPAMAGANGKTRGGAQPIGLPRPALDGRMTVEAALRSRQSIREFRPGSVTIAEIAQILWAAQGMTDRAGHRTAPSAGALYPLEIVLIAGDVESLPAGLYRYGPHEHALEPGPLGDRRAAAADAALGQGWIADAQAILVVSAVAERTTGKYGRRGVRYIQIEAGHAAQNVYLQVEALGLGTTIVGAFDDDAVAAVAELRRNETPLCLLPVGRRPD